VNSKGKKLKKISRVCTTITLPPKKSNFCVIRVPKEEKQDSQTEKKFKKNGRKLFDETPKMQ
jgi:hypothetical protein